jgi:hypothetical protein
MKVIADRFSGSAVQGCRDCASHTASNVFEECRGRSVATVPVCDCSAVVGDVRKFKLKRFRSIMR